MLIKYPPLPAREFTSYHRAISMADDFPRAEVIGVDLAPIQPRYIIQPTSIVRRLIVPTSGPCLQTARKPCDIEPIAPFERPTPPFLPALNYVIWTIGISRTQTTTLILSTPDLYIPGCVLDPLASPADHPISSRLDPQLSQVPSGNWPFTASGRPRPSNRA